MTAAKPDTRLVTRIETSFPGRLSSESRNLLFVSGACYPEAGRLASLEFAAGGEAEPAIAHSMPRPDLAANLGDAALRSGFWAILPIPASQEPRTISVDLLATLTDGCRVRECIGTIDVVPPPTPEPAADPAPRRPRPRDAPPLIAICMATYEPPTALLEAQLNSIRAQTDEDWVCVISDDYSSPAKLAALIDMVGDDPRFRISPSSRRRGFFHNFERALRHAPPEATLVALADQDDRWHPDKLATLRSQMGGATIAYSDARIVDADGTILSPTYWNRRRNNSSDLASLLLANTVSGSAALFRRRVVQRALPFPHGFGKMFHDHWLALVGLALGEIAYVDRPLYDYVQHDEALLGHERASAWAGKPPGLARRIRRYAGDPRYYYEHWRTTYFQEYCRVAGLARLLLMRCGPELSEPRRRMLRRLVDAERSPGPVAWLLARQLRPLAGRDETLGAERRLVRALIWRKLLEAQSGDAGAARRWLPRYGGFQDDAIAEPTAASRVGAG